MADDEVLPRETISDPSTGYTLLVSLPKNYVSSTDTYDVLFVLDSTSSWELVASAALACHDAVQDKDGRQWHPELIVVGIQDFSIPAKVRSDPQAMCTLVTQMAIPAIGMRYRTKPYAAARA
eukprot:600833-Prymnesium_polylepis.1